MRRHESTFKLVGEEPLWILMRRGPGPFDPPLPAGTIKLTDAGYEARPGEDQLFVLDTFATLDEARTALEIYR